MQQAEWDQIVAFLTAKQQTGQGVYPLHMYPVIEHKNERKCFRVHCEKYRLQNGELFRQCKEVCFVSFF